MNRLPATLFAVELLLGAGGLVCAQDPDPQEASAPVVQQVETLDIKGVMKLEALEKLKFKNPSPKTEYERDPDYDKRVADHAVPVRVLIPYSLLNPVRNDMGYNAEKQGFMIGAYHAVLVIDKKSRPSGSYVGTNGFGASTVVRRFDGASIEINFQGVGRNYNCYRLFSHADATSFHQGFGSGVNELRILVPCQPSEAPNTKKSLAIVVDARLARIERESVSSGATMDSPTEFVTHTTKYEMNFEGSHVYLVDLRTNKILAATE